MCEITIAQYNEMFNENLPEDHHIVALLNLQLIIDQEKVEINTDSTNEKG